MNRILIAFDGSPAAESSLGDMLTAGLPAELECTVLAAADVVIPPSRLGGESAAVLSAQGRSQEELQAAENKASRAARTLHGMLPSWKVEPVVVAGSPAQVILDEARERQVDLIVMGAHSHSALDWLFAGSVASSVIAEAPCSVRACRPHRNSFNHPRILIGVDGSAGAEAAVSAALGRSWPVGTAFHVVAVIDARLVTALASSESAAAALAQEAGADTNVWVGRMVERTVAMFRAAGHLADGSVLSGDPKKVLVRHADEWGANCIFIGAQGIEHGSQRRLGSLASALASRAHCNVEIVRQS